MNTKNYFLKAMLAAFMTAMMTISCSTNDNPIVIPESPEVPGNVGGAPGSDAPSGIVMGQVVDENGEAIIGATVKVKDTATSTVTDLNGNFTLDVQSDGSLEVSYIGYQTKVVPFTVGQTLNIILEENSTPIDDIVIR